jgi:multidrug transporter EmrE-like cation transporter
MTQHAVGGEATSWATSVPAMLAALIVLNVVFSIVANAAFRVSARSETWTGVVTWQVAGNLAGFVTVVTLTGLLRWVPLAIAFPVTTGLSILGVQIVAARWIFNEPVNAMQWTGALLIALGVFLVQRR